MAKTQKQIDAPKADAPHAFEQTRKVFWTRSKKVGAFFWPK